MTDGPTIPLLHPAPPWAERGRELARFHGCTDVDATRIIGGGVDPQTGRPDADFGRGFYTTTLHRQARHWAFARFYKSSAPATRPTVLRIIVPRAAVADLATLAFARGDYEDDAYWSLVQHCRRGAPTLPHDHLRNADAGTGRTGFYDAVIGPVASFWQQRLTIPNSDQISVHTPDAAAVLNAAIAGGAADILPVDPI